MKIKQFLVELIIILYISLMLYTALSKLWDYNLTREQMALMPLLRPFAQVVAWLLPSSEIVIALLLFIPRTRLVGLKLVSVLMLGFTIYVAYMLAFYSNLPCSCGGFLDSLSWPQHLAFNSAFILLGMVAILLLRRKNSNAAHKLIVANN